MPIERPLPDPTPVLMDVEPIPSTNKALEDDYALQLVMETFHVYEIFRTNNHDRRWNTHDELYFGLVEPRVWDGTNIPRASISVPIVFNQVETMVPAIYQNVFNVGPEWFQVSAEAGVDPNEAKQMQDVMSYYLEHPGDDTGINSKADLALAIKSLALYGNGGIYLEWDVIQDRPCISFMDLRDIYVDPTCKSPSIDKGRGTIVRKLLTIDELIALRGDERMSVPDDDTLYSLSRITPTVQADQTKKVTEAIRRINYNPTTQMYAPFPSDRVVEVLVYYSKTRIIWILGRKFVMYNTVNPYKFIPFCFAPCYAVLGRFYAQSIADVQDGNQRYTQALINARLDHLSLQLAPPRVGPRNANTPPSQLKYRPGAYFQYENPKDVQLLAPPGDMANVFNEVQYIELNSEKLTGLNGLTGGIPRPSNANRTMGGMQMQLQGAGNRLSDIVANFENYLLIPMLYKLYEMIKFHKNLDATLPAYNAQQGIYTVSSKILDNKCKFRMSAASRMVTRDKLIQVFPFIAQYMLNGALVSELGSSGKTIDFEVLIRMLQDATNVGQLYTLVRPMNQQEMAARQRPDPRTMADMQKAQLDSQTKLQVAQINNQPSQTDIQAQQMTQQMEMQKMQQELALEQEQAKMDMFAKMMMNKIKLQGEQDKARMKSQNMMQEMLLKRQSIGMDMQNQQQSHAMQMDQQQQQHQLDLAQTIQQAQVDKKAAEINPPKLSQSKRNPKIATRPSEKAESKKKK